MLIYTRGQSSILRLSVIGQPPGLPTQETVQLVNALSHEPEVGHTVSVQLVALRGGYDTETVQRWAETGQCFVELHWTFPDCNYPKFTTHHLLISPSGNPGDISFSGGLGWAEGLLKAMKLLNATDHPDPDDRRPGYVSRQLDDDQVSNSSAATSLTTTSDASIAFSEPAELPNGTGDKNEEQADNGNYNDNADGRSSSSINQAEELQLQLQLELLSRQRREAEARYARNGDASGLLAVLAAARQSSRYWDSSGLPRF
ncbi:hypothetical protein VTG60DRAFT_3335 [Thermothelomyces hinnuleus]